MLRAARRERAEAPSVADRLLRGRCPGRLRRLASRHRCGADRLGETSPSSKTSLAAHIERTVSRLLAVRVNDNAQPLVTVIAGTVAALDELGTTARQARGEARARIIARLGELDAALMTAARDHIDPAAAANLRREVEADLAPFASRMQEQAKLHAASIAYERLLRESFPCRS